jgi:hypothetical protein
MPAAENIPRRDLLYIRRRTDIVNTDNCPLPNTGLHAVLPDFPAFPPEFVKTKPSCSAPRWTLLSRHDAALVTSGAHRHLKSE